MTDKGEKPNRGFVSDQAWDSVNKLLNTYNPRHSPPSVMPGSIGHPVSFSLALVFVAAS